MKNPWVVIAIIVVVLFGGSFWYSSMVAEKANDGVVIEANIKGNPDAAVVLEEYADFQCPACGQFHPVVKEIVSDYSDQLRYEYHHFPLMNIHPFAEPAARAAEAAGQQGKFFEYHDALFENQAAWSQGANPSAFLAQAAQDLELDMDLFTRHQRSSLIREKIQIDYTEGLERGVNSTPTFFLNGEKLELTTIDDLRAAVEAALGIAPVVEAPGVQAVGVDENGDPVELEVGTAPAEPSSGVRFGI